MTVALVTGSKGGLGQRICHAVAREGVTRAVILARSRGQAESVRHALGRARCRGSCLIVRGTVPVTPSNPTRKHKVVSHRVV
jgi:NAD(P)-dependent dehydrogenase (short-subunit alcohol dehydrogenase family)